MISSLSKGYQITIPAKIRHKFGLDIGTPIHIEGKGGKIVITKVGKASLEELFAEARKYKHSLTPKQLERMEEGLYD